MYLGLKRSIYINMSKSYTKWIVNIFIFFNFLFIDDVISDVNDVTADGGWEVYERVSGRGCPGGLVSNFGNLGGGLINGSPGRESGGR